MSIVRLTLDVERIDEHQFTLSLSAAGQSIRRRCRSCEDGSMVIAALLRGMIDDDGDQELRAQQFAKLCKKERIPRPAGVIEGRAGVLPTGVHFPLTNKEFLQRRKLLKELAREAWRQAEFIPSLPDREAFYQAFLERALQPVEDRIEKV